MARKYSWRTWAVAASILVACIWIASENRGRFAADPGFSECRQALLSVAKNPSSAEIPYAKNHGGLRSWRRGSGLRLGNEYGAMMDASASCITDPSGNVTSLTINGETIM